MVTAYINTIHNFNGIDEKQIKEDPDVTDEKGTGGKWNSSGIGRTSSTSSAAHCAGRAAITL